MFGVSNLALFSSLGAAGLIYFVFQLIQHRRFYKDLPKPPHSFLLGHLKLMGEAVALFPPKTHPMYLLTYLAQKHSLPEIFYLDLWPIAPPQMIIISGEAAAQVSTLRPYPINTYVRDLLTPIIGRNIIPTANGSLWKMLHHILGPAFVPRYIKTLLGSITDQALTFHERLKLLADKEVFSMEEELSKLLFDIIGSIVFGFPLDAQKSGSQILTDLKYLLGSFHASFTTWNPITKFRIRLKQRGATKRVNTYIADKAKERFAVMKDEKEPPTRRNASSILDRVLLEKIEDSGGGRKEELDAEYLQLVVDNMKALLVGGFSTSVDTLCYIYTLLGLHPDIMNRLREEHDRIFDPDLATTADLIRQYPSRTNELEYTTAVIKETLRMFPIGSGLRQNPDDSTTLDYKSRSYPTEKQMIQVCQHTIHYDPHNFPEPSTFLPDRHLDSYEPKIDSTTWRPFERGMRACLGQNLAMDKMRIILLLTARSFDFEAVVEPSKTQRVEFTKMDLKLGDQAFQQLMMSAGPRDGMKMRIRSTGRT